MNWIHQGWPLYLSDPQHFPLSTPHGYARQRRRSPVFVSLSCSWPLTVRSNLECTAVHSLWDSSSFWWHLQLADLIELKETQIDSKPTVLVFHLTPCVVLILSNYPVAYQWLCPLYQYFPIHCQSKINLHYKKKKGKLYSKCHIKPGLLSRKSNKQNL